MEKPILFSPLMVNAILNNTKTMTRRVIKHKHSIEEVRPVMRCDQNEKDWGKFILTDENGEDFLIKPRYQVGDVLWVRETWCYVMYDHCHDLLEGANDKNQNVYKASVHSDWIKYAKEKYGYKWKPSIFMPRTAARIFLEVVDVRVERLHDISEDDAMKEGVELNMRGWKCYLSNNPGIKNTAKQSFASLWESINGKDSWKANPWVWAYSFKQITLPK